MRELVHLGNVCEEGDGLTLGHCRVLIMTRKEYVASFAAGELRRMRLAEGERVAAAAKQEVKLARQACLGQEKADLATVKELKRAKKGVKKVCSEGRVVARCGESVA